MKCVHCGVNGTEKETELVGFQGDLLGVIHRDCLADAVIDLCRQRPSYMAVLGQLVQFEDIHTNDPWAIDLTQGKRNARWEAHQVSIAPRRLSMVADRHIATVIFKSNNSTVYSLVDREVTRQALQGFEAEEGSSVAIVELLVPADVRKSAERAARRIGKSLGEWVVEGIIEKLDREG